MADPSGANSGGSPNPKGGNPSQGGDPGAKTTEQLLAEHKAENERKAAKISTLESQLEETNSRIEELEEKSKLTEKDKAELNRLNRRGDTLEDLIEEVEASPHAKGWLGAAEKRAAKAKEEAIEIAEKNILYRSQKEYLEDTAEELGIDYKELKKSISPFYAPDANKTPKQNTRAAVKKWREFEQFKKDKAEIDKKKKEADAFAEKDGNKARAATLEEAKSKGDTMAEMAALGL